ncbi:efflux RND transporter periplasmic adaptor subunit [Facilibium subflavum]|uniref:efflux RND transporter periplasmic adaptor subunit n=1 Tax=Facilibium subflavum TaxID=2219058 RepID=UPI000E659086|nr:efflux RND transporter periplasmic adaptor subunit [Facilibium subflavum]
MFTHWKTKISLSVLFFSFIFCVLGYAKDIQEKVLPIAVNVAKVKKINVPETITAVGHLYAIKQVDLSFDNSGRLQEKYFKNGDRVLAGETVAALNDEQDVASLNSLQAKLDLAKQTYARVKLLEKSGAISKEDIDQKFADLKQAQAEVDQQKTVVEQDKIKAPFTGVLGIYQFDVGAYIPSGTSVVQLTQENPLKIRFAIPADFKPKIAIGNQVKLTTNVYKDKVFTGKVNYIAPTVDASSGTIQIEAEVANDDYLLSPGMFMSVSQILQQKNPVLVVPDMAVQTDQQGRFVYAVQSDNTVKVVHVGVGIIKNGWTQITSGLKEGQEIVSVGGDKLTDGAKIDRSDIPPPDFETLQKTMHINVIDKNGALSAPIENHDNK